MTLKEILQTTKHRPLPIPKRNWQYYQEWNDAVFLHWEVSEQDLRPFIPNEIEIDTFEGKPWVSVVAFTMHKIRPKHLPAFPPLSTFHEVNIRTYVIADGKPSVYFLSIEAEKRSSCFVAKLLSDLPYRHSDMRRAPGLFKSRNAPFNDKLEIEFNVNGPITKPDKLDLWLTERYVLTQDSKTAINQFDIQHVEWPLQKIEIKNIDIKYARFNRLLNAAPDVAHYSKGVQVLAWGKQQLYPL